MLTQVINIAIAFTLPTLINGNTQHSSCTNVQIQVQVEQGKHQEINNNTIIYRPVNAIYLTVRCQCTNGNGIPTWLLPSGLVSSCNNQSVGICIMNVNKRQQQKITFQSLKKEYSGYYKCHSDSIFTGFSLIVFG